MKRTYEATATATLDRAEWDKLKAALAPVRVQPLATVHFDGDCSIIVRVLGHGEALDVELARCTHGLETCARRLAPWRGDA